MTNMKVYQWAVGIMMCSCLCFFFFYVTTYIQQHSYSSLAYEKSFHEEKTITTLSKAYVYEPGPITITFAGDLMMSGSIADTVATYGVHHPFVYVKEEIQQSDFAVVNLETAITERTESYPKSFHFKMPPHYVEGIKEAGFSLVSLANNHTMDYKEEGILDTINTLEKYELPYVGAGRNKEEAYSAHTVDLKGKTVSFLGFSRVLPSETWYAQEDKPGIASGYQIERMISIIEEEKKKADYVLVYIHWGVERKQTPESYQVHYGKSMIDAGADAIIGAHPHVLQPIEIYNDKPIAYSIGNFLFPSYVSGPTAETGLLHIQLEEEQVSVDWSPYKIENDQIHPLPKEASPYGSIHP
ncbi:CapA family protein [Alkalihalobacterium bogoriense]|uniref:CapA family protein n=1 Tax=Alkalihalobacterium bogoriense TaxID=246272 RepID=UPI0006883283|nr:CapA family protein [Alkalihalobacterium bogoriense]